MKFITKLDTQQKNKLQWFGKGAGVIIIAVCAFAFFSVVNVWTIFGSSIDSQAEFLENTLKCVIVIISASLFWYFITVQEYKTVFDDLFDILSDDESEADDIQNPYASSSGIDTLVESANLVIRKNMIYKTKLEAQNELIFENFIMRLMRGRIRDIPSAYENADALGINLRGTQVQVIIFQTGNTDESDMHDELKTLIASMLFVAFGGYTVEVDGVVACLVMPQSGEDLRSTESKTEIKRIARLILNIILNKYDTPAKFAIASVDTGVSGIEKSFSEAIELLQYADITGDTDCLLTANETSALHMSDTDDYFWVKKEMQFMNCINAADYQSASVLFNEILDSDYIRNELPIKLANCRMLGLINSMINALGKIRLSMDAEFFEKLDPWEQILNCKSIPELKKCSTELFNSINYYNENQKKQTPYEKLALIVDYTKENFSDPNISVAAIADEFDINVSYLSRTFKKLMGIGLAEYLQRIRVEKALELMKQGDLTVKEVSEQVGYTSVLTMNRAFKKFEGTTAGKLRGN